MAIVDAPMAVKSSSQLTPTYVDDASRQALIGAPWCISVTISDKSPSPRANHCVIVVLSDRGLCYCALLMTYKGSSPLACL